MKFLSALPVVVLSSFAIASFSQAAPKAQYQMNMRVGVKGSAPMSINTPIKAGKKASVTELSEDGQVETSVLVSARKSTVDSKSGLMMDVTVTKRVKGQIKFNERAQMFAPENEEKELKQAKALSLAVVVHQL